MELKRILVLIDNLPQADGRLNLAIDLARRHRAELVGLNVEERHLFALKRGNDKGAGEELGRLFLEQTAAADVKARWLSADAKVPGGGAAEAVNHYATFADLVVLGQSEHGTKERRAADNLPEKVVLGSGKPVLIVPYAGQFQGVGSRVLVAWKGGRESSRALQDSLPILKAADSVHIFEVNPSSGELADMESLSGYLLAHGVQAEVETSAITELQIGDVLLNRVADEGSDLLVMGGYDLHFGNCVLGEVAKHVLRHMTVPVLMSH